MERRRLIGKKIPRDAGFILVPQSQNSTDSKATVEDYIALLSEWHEFCEEIIRTGTIIKNIFSEKFCHYQS